MKVSVCIMAYNHERWIAQALHSALAQDLGDAFEVVVGEDGSSDRTAEIVRAYASKHPAKIRAFFRGDLPKIRVNGRATGRANLLANLEAARGEYVALLDGDDYWTDRGKLRRQLECLERHSDADVCHHPVAIVNEETGAWRLKDDSPQPEVRPADALLRFNFISTSSAFFRNDRRGAYPEWIKEFAMGDWPLFVLHAGRGNVRRLPEVMGVYRQHPQSSWWGRGSRLEMHEELLAACDLFRKHLGPERAAAVREGKALMHVEASKHAWIEKKFGRSVRHLSRAFGSSPLTASRRMAQVLAKGISGGLRPRPPAFTTSPLPAALRPIA